MYTGPGDCTEHTASKVFLLCNVAGVRHLKSMYATICLGMPVHFLVCKVGGYMTS